MKKTQTFKTPDGKPLEGFTKAQLKQNCIKNLNFWKNLENEKGWKREAKKNIKFWNYLLRQTKP